MALSQKISPYEILIRLNADGLAGAHYQTISEIYEDGNPNPVSASISPPIPLALAQEQGANLPDLLGEVSAGLLIQVETLTRQLQDAHDEIEKLRSSQ